MKMFAMNTVNLGGGKFAAPGDEFEITNESDVKALVEAKAAVRKTKTVADDSDDKLPLTDVLALADKEGVTLAAFKTAAAKHLAAVPNKKEDIIAALLALPPEQPVT